MAHESEYGFLDQYGPSDQYVVLEHPGSLANQTKSGQRQTGSYALLNQFQNTVKFVHRKILQRNKLRLGHALKDSCLHGTWQYECLHVNEAHFLKLQPLDHYAQ